MQRETVGRSGGGWMHLVRDHNQLTVFQLADKLAKAVYRESRGFPREEIFGLTSQIRRAAVSVAANIVEGCARSSQADYLRFIEIAYGSSRELQYALLLCEDLGYFDDHRAAHLHNLCTETAKALNGLLRSLGSSSGSKVRHTRGTGRRGDEGANPRA